MQICTASVPPRFDVGEARDKHWAACWLYGSDEQRDSPKLELTAPSAAGGDAAGFAAGFAAGGLAAEGDTAS
jgi:hypothetical protein